VFKAIKKRGARDLSDAELRAKVGGPDGLFREESASAMYARQRPMCWLAGVPPRPNIGRRSDRGRLTMARLPTIWAERSADEGTDQLCQLADKVGKKLKGENYSQIPQLEYAGQRDQAPIFRPFA